jgi:hypothetical protein
MFQDLWAYFRGPSRGGQARHRTPLDVESLEDRLALSSAAHVPAPHASAALMPKHRHPPHHPPHHRPPHHRPPQHPLPVATPLPEPLPPAPTTSDTGKRVTITLTGLGPSGKDTLVIPPEENFQEHRQDPLGSGHQGALFEQGGNVVTHDGWITLLGANNFLNIPRDGSLGTTFNYASGGDVDIHLYAPSPSSGFDALQGFVIPASLKVGDTGTFPPVSNVNGVPDPVGDGFIIDRSPSPYANGGWYQIVRDVNDRRYVILLDHPPSTGHPFAFTGSELVIPRDGSVAFNVPLLATTDRPDLALQYLQTSAQMRGLPARPDNPAGGNLPDVAFVESSLKREEDALVFSATLPPGP